MPLILEVTAKRFDDWTNKNRIQYLANIHPNLLVKQAHVKVYPNNKKISTKIIHPKSKIATKKLSFY